MTPGAALEAERNLPRAAPATPAKASLRPVGKPKPEKGEGDSGAKPSSGICNPRIKG